MCLCSRCCQTTWRPCWAWFLRVRPVTSICSRSPDWLPYSTVPRTPSTCLPCKYTETYKHSSTLATYTENTSPCITCNCCLWGLVVCVCDFSREVQECVPPPFYGKQGSQPWLNMTTHHMQQVQPLNPHQARAQFLGKTTPLCECMCVCISESDSQCEWVTVASIDTYDICQCPISNSVTTFI